MSTAAHSDFVSRKEKRTKLLYVHLILRRDSEAGVARRQHDKTGCSVSSFLGLPALFVMQTYRWAYAHTFTYRSRIYAVPGTWRVGLHDRHNRAVFVADQQVQVDGSPKPSTRPNTRPCRLSSGTSRRRGRRRWRPKSTSCLALRPPRRIQLVLSLLSRFLGCYGSCLRLTFGESVILGAGMVERNN